MTARTHVLPRIVCTAAIFWPAYTRGAETEQVPAAESVMIRGRVLDPDGKPVAGAKVYLFQGLKSDQRPTERAVCDSDGRFTCTASRNELVVPTDDNAWKRLQIVASAEGFGTNCVEIAHPDRDGKWTVRLVLDDVPIDGRLLGLEGRPVAGATIRVLSVEANAGENLSPFIGAKNPGLLEHSQFWTKFFPRSLTAIVPSVSSDSQGRFRLTGIGRERKVWLRVEGPSLAAEVVRAMTRRGAPLRYRMVGGEQIVLYGAIFEHVAAPAKPVIGIVRAKDSGRPLPGVTIESSAGTAKTDADGRYRLDRMPKAPQGFARLLKAVPSAGQPYFVGIGEIVDSAGLDPITVDFELRRAVRIAGDVTEAGSKLRVVGAVVTYRPLADNPHLREVPRDAFVEATRTDGNGRYELLGLPGSGLVAVMADENRYLTDAQRRRAGESLQYRTVPATQGKMCHATVEINLTDAADRVPCDVALEPGPTRPGRVLDNDGRPLAGTQIIGLKPSWRTWEALDTADFSLAALLADESRTLVLYHGERKLAGTCVARGGTASPVSIKLRPWGAVTGRFVDGGGKPRGDLRVLVLWADREQRDNGLGMPTYALPALVEPAKDGRFRIVGLVPGMKYVLGAAGPNEEPTWRIDDLTVDEGATKDLGDLKPQSRFSFLTR